MSEPQALALTGASGYVGSCLGSGLGKDFLVVPMGRRAGTEGIRWSLGGAERCAAALRARKVTTLVHTAWDFSLPRPRENWTANVEGSKRLLEDAQAAGIQRVIFLSTISAFTGAVSEYGKAKLAVEEQVLSLHGTMQGHVVRPGLVWGQRPGGMFGSLRGQVRKGGLVPVVGDGRFPQYLVHEDDLTEVVRQLCLDGLSPREPLTAAHPKPWQLRDLILRLANEAGTHVRLVGIPWRLIYAGLKSAELLGMKPAFRSDSLLSLVRQDPAPAFSKEFPFRAFI